jgi:transcriptional regulator with XRE-family HTH domain
VARQGHFTYRGYPRVQNASRRSLPETLKAAARATGLSVNSLAKQSGVPQAVLQRFLAGQRGITLETAERLCAWLGLELHPVTGASSRGKAQETPEKE